MGPALCVATAMSERLQRKGSQPGTQSGPILSRFEHIDSGFALTTGRLMTQ